MMVREKKRAPAHKGETPKIPAQTYTFPAPLRGWVLDESLALPTPGAALILDNWICTTTGIRPRGGSATWATLDAPVASMFTYTSTSEKFFAATAGSIFDITAPADPDVTPTADVTGQASGYYSTAQFGTAGGDYLYAVNGADSAQLYDGSSWMAVTGVSSPAITGVATSALSFVWSFANRLFFVEKDTMTAWYLPVDSIGGAASSFSLAGIFKKGGSLLFGATWSLDAGDGLDDKCIFVSTEGEVAVYQGTNPGSAADWAKVGVYDITRPLGGNATMQAGGDLLIATEVGLVPISKAINIDEAALAMQSVSSRITPYWQSQASALTNYPWEVLKWPEKNIAIVSQPAGDSDMGSCLVVNLQTQAWSRFKGFTTRCLGYYAGFAYSGGTDSIVRRLESSGSDSGEIYTSAYLGQFEDMGQMGMEKTVTMARATFQSAFEINPQVTVQTNFDTNLSAPPDASPDTDGGNWDAGLWDVATWDAGARTTNRAQWNSVGRTGYKIAPEVQLTFGNTSTPNAELVSIDALFDVGAFVT